MEAVAWEVVVVEVEKVVKVMVRVEVVVFVVEVMVGGTTLMHRAFLLLCFPFPSDFHCALLHDLSLKKVERPPIFKVTGAFHA